jgi:hypothetical protein
MAGITFKEIAINMLLAGLFLFAVFSFATGTVQNYGLNESIVKDERIDFDSLESNIQETSEDAKKWEEAIMGENIFVSFGALVLFSIWGVIKLIWISTFGIYNILMAGASDVLGIPSIAMGVLTAILIIVLIFAGWRVIKSGE